MPTYHDLIVDEQTVRDYRMQLYHSSGPGYIVIPQFVNAEFTEHMRQFWRHPDARHLFRPFLGEKNFYNGCPNGASVPNEQGNHAFYNFFWNRPVDEVTYDVALHIQLLRSRVEARPTFTEIFPLNGRSTSFRVVMTRNGKNIVPPHRDYDETDGPDFDPKRLQATLVLAEKGQDYQGTGFQMENNQGQLLTLGDDIPVKPGDLLLWCYGNLHAIPDVQTRPDQLGFLRILFPPELIHSSRIPLGTLGGRVKVHMKQNPIVARYGIPLYRKLMGRV